MAEINLYTMHSCTLSHCSDLRIWLGLEDLAAAKEHEQEHSRCSEGNLTVFEEDSSTWMSWNCSSQVWSE